MEKQIRFSSEIRNLGLVEKFVEEVCDYHNINDTYFGNIVVSITEAVENAMVHGNSGNKDSEVSLKVFKSARGLSFSIRDEGKGFDYQKYMGKAKSDPDEDRKGLLLIDYLADDISFNENGNEITITFDISSINREISLRRISMLLKYQEEKKAYSKSK